LDPTEASASIGAELAALQQARVLVVGDIMLDRYLEGRVERISPEAPVAVLHCTSERSYLGGAANVAANLASIGASTSLVGRIGRDQEATNLRHLLEQAKIVSHLFTSESVPTITKTRAVAAGRQLLRLDREEICPLSDSETQDLVALVTELLATEGFSALVLADYAKGTLPPQAIRSLIALANKAEVWVICDPKAKDLSLYAGCSVIKPNLAEAVRGVGDAVHRPKSEHFSWEAARNLAEEVLRVSGARNVTLSCSEHGLVLAGREVPEPVWLKAAELEVADVSGAGDTLVALLAAGLGGGLSLVRAAEIANQAAGLVCSKPGTAVLSPTELLAALVGTKGSRRTERKLLRNYEEAREVGVQFRRDGRKLVFANGCFDLLHAGHIHLLQTARGFGDALMVALNSDTSVRRLKGPERPIQPAEDRAQILAALEYVDFVVVFEEDDPLNLIMAVKPAFLVKGDDYSPEQVVGAREVASWGGSVQLVRRLPTRSTSAVIAAITAMSPGPPGLA
jgi:D-beta-D-heptose 7-phosphate kinase/D-beta-D-heptose 1-phosphate adenosyltransferase